MSDVLELTRDLVRRPSITPDDADCQSLLARRLRPLGFSVETMRFGDVDNLWARRGTAGPVLCLAGHTDVVPTGPVDAWQHPPFDGVIADGLLWGRGAADMKASLAAMVVACEEFVAAHPDHAGSVAFLITSDEEGPARDGTRAVMETLTARDEHIDWCLIGEPSSKERLGDMVRIGRRGSLSVDIRVRGVQGHVAYPDLADNPLHRLAPALLDFVRLELDAGNAAFPPSGLQLTNVQAGTGFRNVTPGFVDLKFNIRYSTEQTFEGLQARVLEILDRHGLDYEVDWRDAGRPFITGPGPLRTAVQETIRDVAGLETELSTGGGTSDGRFIAPAGTAVVELGPVNASIHKVNEHVAVADLEPLKDMYRGVMERLLT